MPSLYTSLDEVRSEIRLLTLLPGKPTDPLRCTLETTSLDCDPSFEALSYVWGEAGTLGRISIHPEKESEITTNLEAALRALRHADKPRLLWVDALCIDQINIEEKNVQIPLMGRVYSEAASVLVWLGDIVGGEVELAAQLITTHNKEDALSKLEAAHLIECLGGVFQLGTRPYWNRMWTFQEYRLAKKPLTLLCGNYNFGNMQLLDAMILIASEIERRAGPDISSDIIRKTFNRFEPVSWLYSELEGWYVSLVPFPGESDSLLRLLIETSMRECRDPRDHIYALYGMIAPAAARALPPDYTKSPRRVFWETAIHLIRIEGFAFASLLRFFPLYEDRLQSREWPSWVPKLDVSSIGIESANNFQSSIWIDTRFKAGETIKMASDAELLLFKVESRLVGRCRVKFRFQDTASDIASQLKELLKDETKRDGIVSAVAAPSNLEKNAPEHLIRLIQTLSNPDMNLNIRADLGQEEMFILNKLRGKTLFHIRDDRIAIGVAAIQDEDAVVTAART